MNETQVAVLGAGGYTGMLLCRLLARHPGVSLALLGSERLAKEGLAPLGDPLLPAGLPVAGEGEAAARCAALGVQVALLCTPAEASLELAPQLLARGIRVLDLSGAFRLADAAVFQRAYGLPHTAPAALAGAIYALPEVTGTAGLREAALVSNPGCYVTAALLCLAPLVRHRLIDLGDPLFIDGKSGASGAGRKAAVELSLCELEGDLRPYRLGRHQHTPEIAGVLSRLGDKEAAVVFVPHLCGTRRGLLVTCHGKLGAGVEPARLHGALLHDYAETARVHVVRPEEVSLRRPVGTPDAWVAVHGDPETGTFCALGCLDNLLKGAASQAVQNLNAMLGLPDGTGLEGMWSAA